MSLSVKLIVIGTVPPATDHKMPGKFPGKDKWRVHKSAYEQKHLTFHLLKYAGRDTSGINWQYKGAAQQLNETLTASGLAKTLNEQTLLPADHVAAENDLLKIEYRYLHPAIKNKPRPFIGAYISAIFQEGKWKANDGYDHVMKNYDAVYYGVVELAGES